MAPFLQAKVSDTDCDHAYVVAALDLTDGKRSEAAALLDRFPPENLSPFWKPRFEKLRIRIQNQRHDRKITSFILHCRLENAHGCRVSHFRCWRCFSPPGSAIPFISAWSDFLFILLPVGILGVKCLLGLLLSSEVEGGENPDAIGFLVQFFRPLLKIFRDWFPFLLLSACYYSLYSNLILQVNPHKADAFLSKVTR